MKTVKLGKELAKKVPELCKLRRDFATEPRISAAADDVLATIFADSGRECNPALQLIACIDAIERTADLDAEIVESFDASLIERLQNATANLITKCQQP